MCQNPILPLYTNNIILQVDFLFYAKTWYQKCLAYLIFFPFFNLYSVCMYGVCVCVLNVHLEFIH